MFWQFLCGVLALLAVALMVKIRFLYKSMEEIQRELTEHLSTDTNTLISVSSGDRHVRQLAADLNRELRRLRKQRKKYENGDRELKEAVTNISHDLRTPLTAIMGYLELLKQTALPVPAETTRYLSLMENRILSMKQLTEELFRYSVIMSREQDMCLEMVDINAALEESIAEFYAALTQKNIVPKISMPKGHIYRELDKKALSRVFGNLINNALKYSDGDLEICLETDGVIRFTNTAAGLDEIQVGRLFDRFFSVDTARNSSGIGLSIARALVEQMNGQIDAKYENDRLCISVEFPVKPVL